jgi:NTE family protein
MSELGGRSSVALVLAGGGARGAYEAGALSVLLPALDERGERPRIVLGTSAGALNAGFFAAGAHLAPADLVPKALAIWESVSWGEVARGLFSGASLRRVGEYAGEVLGVPRARLESLLDPEPLRTTLRQWVDFPQVGRNLESGVLDVAGVVATSALTGRSVVFHWGLQSPPADPRRGIDYVATPLTEAHVLASSAIPAAFPAVHVDEPRIARGWYFDGGTRLNTPIRPALDFGAERVVVVALNSLAQGPPQLAGEDRPDALQGVGQILVGLLDDQLTADVQTLATINRLGAVDRRIPYILVAPPQRDSIAQLALQVVREHYDGLVDAIRSPDIALLTRLTAGETDSGHAELLSFLLFAPEFSRALIELGQQDARRWIAETHDLDGLWQVGPMPAS